MAPRRGRDVHRRTSRPDERIALCETADGLATRGLDVFIGAEVAVPAVAADQGGHEDLEALLEYISDYIVSERAIVRSGETLVYGYWLLRFSDVAGSLEIWELTPDGGEWVRGAETAMRYWRQQRSMCKSQDAAFAPPLSDRLMVVTDGVLEGDPTQGVRYPSPEHMSGWWLSTDRYTGDIESTRVLHAYHVTARRPDLARFLALPFGYRFYEDGAVVFDREAAGRAPA